MGRLALNVLLSFVQFERELASERGSRQSRRLSSLGQMDRQHCSTRLCGQGHELVINPKEAETVRIIFKQYLAQKIRWSAGAGS